ncbi:unnamed protein product, partial [Gulo gulo]
MNAPSQCSKMTKGSDTWGCVRKERAPTPGGCAARTLGMGPADRGRQGLSRLRAEGGG